MYRMLGADGRPYGPVDADGLRQWVREGRANRQTLVQIEGSAEWQPLGTFPEFAALFDQGTSPPSPVRPPAIPGMAGRPSEGLAITSLVLGVLALVCMGLLAGVPAIITGHIALSRSRRQPMRYGGGGLAVAGLVMGYLSLVSTMFLAGLLRPALTRVKAKAQSIGCVNNLKQIGLAARLYADSHKDVLPPSFQAMAAELGNPSVLVCVSDSEHLIAKSWASFTSNNVTYEFLKPGLNLKTAPPNTVVFRCPIHGHEALVDGSVLLGSARQGRSPPPDR